MRRQLHWLAVLEDSVSAFYRSRLVPLRRRAPSRWAATQKLARQRFAVDTSIGWPQYIYLGDVSPADTQSVRRCGTNGSHRRPPHWLIGRHAATANPIGAYKVTYRLALAYPPRSKLGPPGARDIAGSSCSCRSDSPSAGCRRDDGCLAISVSAQINAGAPVAVAAVSFGSGARTFNASEDAAAAIFPIANGETMVWTAQFSKATRKRPG
jgi:hypothetical protein